jgi:glycosyltransferase involved in cell wall biosynthesis
LAQYARLPAAEAGLGDLATPARTPPAPRAHPRVTLFVPVLNEIQGMKAVLPEIPAGSCDQVLIADGGSTDGSVEYARSLGFDTYVQRRKGIRHAYMEAWPLIRGDIVITFSPDGNCPAAAIPRLIAKMSEGYDMVVASRYLGDARSEDDDLLTGFGNWLFTRLINRLHGGHYTDAMGIFRAYRTSLFAELALDKEDSYATERLLGTIIGIEPLLSIRSAKRRLRIGEIPCPEPPRIGGQRKLQMFRWGGAYLLQVFRETYYYR